MLEIIKSILTDANFIGAIISSLGFIFLGFLLRNKNIITTEGKKVLTFIVLKVALPAMAFSSFMTDFNVDSFNDNLQIFILSLILYIVLLAIGHLIFVKKGKDKSVFSILIVVGQLTFFSIPILNAVYGSSKEVLLPANMMTLAFRLILYIYCYLVISKLSFNKNNMKESIKKLVLNPIMIAMFIGIFVWISQLFIPTVNINGIDYSILRIDKTIPSLFVFISACEKLTTPLALIVIGCILGEAHFLASFKDKFAWLLAVLKTVCVPIVILLVVLLFQGINLINFNEYEVAVLVLGFGAPLSAVINTYCSTYENNANTASRVCFLSTLLCIITYPILFVVIKLIITMPIFM